MEAIPQNSTLPNQSGLSTLNSAPLISVLPVVSGADYEAQKKAEADAQAAKLAGEKVAGNLINFLERCRTEAMQAKQDSGVTDQLLDAQRRRKGEHSALKKAQLVKYNLPDYWVPVTQTKCIHTEAWLRDLLMPYADKIWKCASTEEPELQQDEKDEIQQSIMREVQQFMLDGGMASDEQIHNVIQSVEEKYKFAVIEEAKNKAKNMELRIQDQHEECDFRGVFDEFRANLTTYGTAFLKGPFTINKKSPKWNGTKRVVVDKLIPSCSAPSPHDIFPAPWAKNENEGYIIERIRTYREGLSSVRKLEYYQTKEIEAFLSEFQATTSVSTQPSDNERNINENKSVSAIDNRLECYLYTGPIAGYMLKDWGLDNIDPADDYNVEVLWGKTHVLKVMPMWDETGVKQYFRAVFKKVPGSFWGIGVPLLMSASQDRANAAMITLLDNMNWGAGFIGWLNQLRLVNIDDAKAMYPKKWIPTQPSTNPGDNGPPMGIVEIPLHIAEIDAIYQKALSDADNESGVPAYMYGSGSASPASGTFSGLSTLMSAAARGVKDALLEIDIALSKFIQHWADWLNLYSDDESIKGDIRVVCSGSTGLFVQEMALSKLDELANQAKDVIAITGPRFVIDILRQKAKILKADYSMLPTDDELKAKQENAGPEPTPVKPSFNVSVKWELLSPEEKASIAQMIPEMQSAVQPPLPPAPAEVSNVAASEPPAPKQQESITRVKPLPPIQQ